MRSIQRRCRPGSPRRAAAGLLLVELLVAMAIGLGLVGQIAQSTLLETGQARRLGRLLRERVVSQRALELMRIEVQDALEVSLGVPEGGHANCGLAGRTVVLHLLTAAGRISYSLEPRPGDIWRGQALMRCGPSYGLWGTLNDGGSSASRVLVDAVAPDGFVLSRLETPRMLQVQLRRQFQEPGRAPQEIRFTLSMPAPGLGSQD